MSEDQKAAEQRRRLGIPQGLDPRRAVDPATMERMIRAQAAARAQAQAATTVVIGTIVTLISSAFGFVAALAWNDAIIAVLGRVLNYFHIDNTHIATVQVIRAVIFTIIAVIAIVVLQRIAGRWAKKAAITAAAGEGSY